MSNQTDFKNVAQELCDALFLEDESGRSRKRFETALHDAFVAGQENENRELRDALEEALDIIENGYQYFGSPEQAGASLKAKIAKWRSKHSLAAPGHRRS